MIDIDARKRAEFALRETEVRLETAVWGGDIGLWDKGSDGQFCFLNNWCDRVDIDYPTDGRDQNARWRAQIHPEDAERYAQAKDDFYRGGAGRRDQTARLAQLRAVPGWQPAPRPPGQCGCVREGSSPYGILTHLAKGRRC